MKDEQKNSQKYATLGKKIKPKTSIATITARDKLSIITKCYKERSKQRTNIHFDKNNEIYFLNIKVWEVVHQ